MSARAIASLAGLFSDVISLKYGFAGSKSVSNISAKERVVFFTTHSWYDAKSHTWNVPIHGRVYEFENRRIVRAVFTELLQRKYGLKANDHTEENYLYRTKLLTADNESGKRIVVKLCGKRYVLPKTQANGHFKATIAVPADTANKLASNGTLDYELVLRPNIKRSFIGKSILVEDEGVSIISDIDDTIKLSYVTDHKKLFESSFFNDFEPVAGMPELYQQWLQQGASFHYVSSSPWQLYEPLDEFLNDYAFPMATMSLKMVRFKDETFFNLFKSATKTKPQAIDAIIKHYQNRKFVLIGDSGEKDAQVYAEIAKSYPDHIAKIYIRNVDGSELESIYKVIFDGLPQNLWQIFHRPEEISLDLRQL